MLTLLRLLCTTQSCRRETATSSIEAVAEADDEIEQTHQFNKKLKERVHAPSKGAPSKGALSKGPRAKGPRAKGHASSDLFIMH